VWSALYLLMQTARARVLLIRYEEEDFSPNAYGFDLSPTVPVAAVLAALDAVEAELRAVAANAEAAKRAAESAAAALVTLGAAATLGGDGANGGLVAQLVGSMHAKAGGEGGDALMLAEACRLRRGFLVSLDALHSLPRIAGDAKTKRADAIARAANRVKGVGKEDGKDGGKDDDDDDDEGCDPTAALAAAVAVAEAGVASGRAGAEALLTADLAATAAPPPDASAGGASAGGAAAEAMPLAGFDAAVTRPLLGSAPPRTWSLGSLSNAVKTFAHMLAGCGGVCACLGSGTLRQLRRRIEDLPAGPYEGPTTTRASPKPPKPPAATTVDGGGGGGSDAEAGDAPSGPARALFKSPPPSILFRSLLGASLYMGDRLLGRLDFGDSVRRAMMSDGVPRAMLRYELGFDLAERLVSS